MRLILHTIINNGKYKAAACKQNKYLSLKEIKKKKNQIECERKTNILINKKKNPKTN